MKPPLETIRVSEHSRDILMTLKRRTGIERWNVLCRWAICESLGNPANPVHPTHLPESNIEMSWDVFAGEMSQPLLAALYMRAVRDGVPLEKNAVAHYFRSHLERGIAQLQAARDLQQFCTRGGQIST